MTAQRSSHSSRGGRVEEASEFVGHCVVTRLQLCVLFDRKVEGRTVVFSGEQNLLKRGPVKMLRTNSEWLRSNC